MRHLSRLLLGAATTLVAASLFLYGCQGESLDPTRPDLARSKADRTLTVAGGGAGSGKVTASQVLEEVPLNCVITAGRAASTGCSQTYAWKSAVTLTATPDAGNTFAGWSGACSGTATTCKVTMTQHRSVTATFSGSGVASYALAITGLGTGSGTVQSQTGLSPAISCAIKTGTAASGTCSASYPNATSVTLTPTPAAGHSFTGWSGACSGTGPCTLSMTAARTATAKFTAPPGRASVEGKWTGPSPLPNSTRIIGLHLSLLHSGDLLLWGHAGDPYAWNVTTGAFTAVANNTCANGACELFCAGHTFLADGSLLVAGGHNEALGDGYGIKQASIFDGGWDGSPGDLSYARWYPTLVTLASGEVVALAGTQEPNLQATYPERYSGGRSGSWTTLSTASLSLPYYPRAFLEPKNGWVFYAGEANPSRYLNPSGTGTWTTSGLGNSGNRVVGNRQYGSAVMLDSKVLYVGGGGANCPATPQSTAEIIDLSAGTPAWSAVAPMSIRRRQTNATILPDGRVLVTGGTAACGFNVESGAVWAAEVYDPATNQWTMWANASVVRTYHSTTALLPDGRVLSTGNGDGGSASQQYNYEIFSPPYLFTPEDTLATRPTISTVSSPTVRYGQSLTITTPAGVAATIRKVTMIRHTATTHAFDEGERLNTLCSPTTTPCQSPDGTSLTVTLPAAPRASPGPYLLFIQNEAGVPSVGRTIVLSP